METSKVEIDIDGRWSLEDLSVMSKTYIQCYSLVYSLSDVELPRAEYERFREYLKGEYSRYPWRGGYSTVNFYKNIFNRLPYEHQPQIHSIRYSSPGSVILTEVATVAAVISGIVLSVAKSLDVAHDTYNKIKKGVSERKLSKIEVDKKQLELLEKEIKFIQSSLDELIYIMNVPPEMIEELEKRSGGNKLMQLKILLSFYRRVEPLALLQADGRLKLQNKQGYDDNHW